MASLLYNRQANGRVSARLRVNGVLKHLGTFDSDELAHAAIKAARPLRGSVTVEAWAAAWLRLYPGRRNAETTGHVAGMCAPFAAAHGSLRLSDVTPLMAQAWAVDHPSQVRYLRQMFGKACKAGLLGLNVWSHVEVDTDSAPRMPPTAVELERMLATARARDRWWPHFADCIEFTAYSGLRREEVERVQAQDVLEAGRRVVVRGKRGAGEVDPRKRVVAVFGPGRAALLSSLPQVGRVWRAEAGGPLSQDVVDKRFGELRRECGVSGVTFHGLRHFVAAWLLDRGASKVDTAIQLGHRDKAGRVDTTQVERVYGHMAVEPALQRLEAIVNEGVPDGDAGAGRGAGADAAAADGSVGERESGAQLPGSAQA